MDSGKKTERLPNPRASANFISAIYFGWMIPVFYNGFKRDLETKDLFQPLEDHKSCRLGDRFESEWEKEVKRAKRKDQQPSFLRAINRIFFWENFIAAVTLIILELVVRMSQPFFIGLLVRYFSIINSELPLPSANDSTYIYRMIEILEKPKTQILWQEAVFFAVAIAFISLLTVSIVHPYMMSVMHQGMQCRVGSCSLIYRKALRLSKTALGNTTVGQLVNLLSNDVSRFDIAVIFMHYLWIAPLEAIITCYFMYLVVDWSTFLGLLFIVLLIPLQSLFRIRALLSIH